MEESVPLSANVPASAYNAIRFNSQVREVINRNTLVSLALQHGYNAFLPVYEGGVDFILYNEISGDTRKVQLKGRWTIDRKYLVAISGSRSMNRAPGMSRRTTKGSGWPIAMAIPHRLHGSTGTATAGAAFRDRCASTWRRIGSANPK